MELEVLPSNAASVRHQIIHHDTDNQSDSLSIISRQVVAVTGSKIDFSASKTTNNVAETRVDDDRLPPMTKKQTVTERIQFLSLCWSLALVGWNDGSTGPLLLRIQHYYNVSYIVVSLLFVFACIGFITGALLIVPLTDRLGLGKVWGSICPVVAYSLQAATLPFPVYVMSFTLNGVGMALLDAQSSGFVAALRHNTNTKMGILHAAYGAGALCSPLVATQFAQHRHWSYHYLVSLGLALANLIIVTAVFRFRTQDECLAQFGQASTPKSTSGDSTFSQIIHSKTVYLLALFLLVYVGVEVTIGGWIVTFIVTVREGGPSSGYISTGFFGGLTLGRVVLLWVNKKVGERRVIFIYAALAIGFELLVWFVPSLIGDAVAISVIGLVLGPMYPITMNHSRRILPPWILTGAIGLLAGFGQAGSAILPFMTGAVAQKWGISSLQPLLIIMMTIMTISWADVTGHVHLLATLVGLVAAVLGFLTANNWDLHRMTF